MDHDGERFTGIRHKLRPGRSTPALVAAMLLGLWLAVVIFTTIQHEYWRDEVRPLSLARAATSPLDLFHLIRYEGHPILWYLLLYLGRSIVDTPLVLPITSLVVAGAAVALFMFRAPFPLWMKACFLFSALPLYEYSVMARDYGISMLLLFVVASLFPRRGRHWLALATALALLANTNIHATILTCLLMAIWAWHEWTARKAAPDQMVGRPFLVAVAIVGLGVLLSVIVVNPPPDTTLTTFYSTTPGEFASAFRSAVLVPSAGFNTLLPPFLPWAVGNVILYLAVGGLLRRPALSLAALAALVGMGVLFRVAYVGYYRHAGLFLCFLLCLYWIAAEEPERGAPRGPWMWLFNLGRYGALLVLVLAGLYQDRVVAVDLGSEMSSSKAFGAFLKASPAFHDAIVVPEPDYFIESLPYYADNAIYFAREHRFGTTVTWSSAAAADLSLGQLVSQAQNLKARYRRPVLVVLGHPAIVTDPTGDVRYLYGKRFTWTAGEREDAARALRPVAKFVAAVTNEKYWVYAVR